MSKKSKPRGRPRIPSETHALRPGPNWPLLAVSSLGIALTAVLVMDGTQRRRRAGMLRRRRVRHRPHEPLGDPARPADVALGIAGLRRARGHRVRPPGRQALVLRLDRRILRRLLQRLPDGGVADDSRVRVSRTA